MHAKIRIIFQPWSERNKGTSPRCSSLSALVWSGVTRRQNKDKVLFHCDEKSLKQQTLDGRTTATATRGQRRRRHGSFTMLVRTKAFSSHRYYLNENKHKSTSCTTSSVFQIILKFDKVQIFSVLKPKLTQSTTIYVSYRS